MLTEVTRLCGTVKSYNARKGFGFITVDTGDSSQIYVHKSELRHTKEAYVVPGDRLTFCLKQEQKGPAAVDVIQVDDAGKPIPQFHLENEKFTVFDGLGLDSCLQQAVAEAGYHTPTPIQTQGIPVVIAGKDLIGCAQTGTGKTAAYALPILQRLITTHVGDQKKPAARVLVLSPTRELALQIGECFTEYGKHTSIRNVVIFGGVGQSPQVKAIQRGAEVFVATPGRLLDLINQGYVKLNSIEILVLDEADRMLDMGFIHDVQRIIRMVPKNREMLLFSATMPQEIKALSNTFMHNPVEITISPGQLTVEIIEQSVYFVAKNKKQALLEYLLKSPAITRALVFTRTKHSANRVASVLHQKGIRADAIHGNKTQAARQNALENFRAGKTRVLVATDVAARGIDVQDISHIIQFDLPTDTEMYIHRIGRTGRAGATGTAIAFCDEGERGCLYDIEKLLKTQIPVKSDHPFQPTPEQRIVVANTPRTAPRSRPNRARFQDRRRR